MVLSPQPKFLPARPAVAALGLLLAWQERAASPDARCWRLVRGVLPATIVLLALLPAFTQLMLLWSRR